MCLSQLEKENDSRLTSQLLVVMTVAFQKKEEENCTQRRFT